MHSYATVLGEAPAEVTIRPATDEDCGRCGEIFYDAFASIATRHDFPIEPGSPEFTQFKTAQMLATDGFYAVVAESGGDLLGAAFVDERDVIAGANWATHWPPEPPKWSPVAIASSRTRRATAMAGTRSPRRTRT